MRPTTLRADAQTDVVVDIGCVSYANEDSIQTLIKRFSPTVLFGFDPHPAMREGVGQVNGTTVITARKAAWTQDGFCGLVINGNCTHLDDAGSAAAVRTFDLANWMMLLPDAKVVLKIDAEGAEYPLLTDLLERGAMDNVTRLIVEWHTGEYANGYESDREAILSQITCPVEEWH